MEQGAGGKGGGDKPGSEAKFRVYCEGRGHLAFTVVSENCKPSLRNLGCPPGPRPAPVHLTRLPSVT